MGYQIANRCYQTKQGAEDAYFSQIVPSISSDGTLYKPVYSPQQLEWKYQGTVLTANFPQCDPTSYMQYGLALAATCIIPFALVFGFRRFVDLIHKLNESSPREP